MQPDAIFSHKARKLITKSRKKRNIFELKVFPRSCLPFAYRKSIKAEQTLYGIRIHRDENKTLELRLKK